MVFKKVNSPETQGTLASRHDVGCAGAPPPISEPQPIGIQRHTSWNLHRSINFCLPPCSIPKLTRRSSFCLPFASERFLTIRAKICKNPIRPCFLLPHGQVAAKTGANMCKKVQNERKSAQKSKRAQIQKMLRIAGNKLHLRGCLEHFLLKRASF